MTWSFPIGHLFGSELRVHATFFLLLAWIGATAWSAGGAPAAIQNVLFVCALFACVVAHEFGHALTARRYGIKTPDITLLPIGGMARLERMPEKPAQEIKVALAGPAVNVGIWAILLAFGAQTEITQLTQTDTTLSGFLGRLAAVNLFIAVFNLLPAFPMDGGRVLRALLSLRTDRVRATQIAAAAGQFLAFALGFLALTTGNIILLLIAVFVFLAGQAESTDVANRAMASTLHARDAVITSFEALRPTDVLHTAGQTLIRTTQHEFPVLNDDGTLAGFLTRTALFRAMADNNGGTQVSQVMETTVPTQPLDAPLQKVFDDLGDASAVAVTDQRGHVLGYITRENLGELMMLRSGKS